MQMIDVLKRLQELDAETPAVDTGAQVVAAPQNISVNESLEECGMMGSMDNPHTPASINMTADSGEELAGMLKDIMSLAGVHKDDSEVLTTEPGMDMEPVQGPPDMKTMIAKVDSLNDKPEDDEEEKPSEELDNTPESPMNFNMANDAELDKGKHNQDPAGHPDVGDRMDGDRPKAFATFEDRLMWEYKNFVAE